MVSEKETSTLTETVRAHGQRYRPGKAWPRDQIGECCAGHRNVHQEWPRWRTQLAACHDVKSSPCKKMKKITKIGVS